jgi:predicted NACHT family NTPase
MIELTIWEGAKAAGIVFWPILKSLAEDSAKDYGKDFFKDCLKNVFRLPEKDVQKEAYLTALEAFLQIFQKELENANYQEGQIKQYLEPIQKFIKQPKVAAILGNAFEVNCKSLDTLFLAKTWQEMNLPFLPEDFDWELIGKLYIRGVKQIITKSEKLRPIYEVQLQAKQAEGIQELVGIAPDFDLGRYAEGLKEQYGNLKLESLDTTGVYYNELKLWKIFVPQNVRECQRFLPQVYEVPKDYIKRLQKSGEWETAALAEEELEKQRQRYINQQSQLVWEVLGDPNKKGEKAKFKHTVILGDPGSGKSSLLQYLSLIWAQHSVSELSLYPIPLLIELRLYGRDKQAGKCKDILSFIHGGNVTCRLNRQPLDDHLKRGNVVALLDGIDEIFDPNLRDEVVRDIHRFSNDYADVQIITTSRWLGYKAQQLRDAGFRHFMLQDLGLEQIEDFIESWHDLTFDKKNFKDQVERERKQARLSKVIKDSKAIRELAVNPLLLTMMAILNRNQELPRDRPELYNQASRVLLHQWDFEFKEDLKNPKLKDWKIDIAPNDKQEMLRKVAYFMQSNKKELSGNFIHKSDLEDILTESLRGIIERGEPRMIARVIIEDLRTRNFILCYLGADSYAFVHRTFLEFFCAWRFVLQFEKEQTLTIEQLINEVFGNHWQDESWHEVLRLICGMIDPRFAEKIIDYLLKQRVINNIVIQKNISNVSNYDEAQYLEREKGVIILIVAANCFAEVKNKKLIYTISDKLLYSLKNTIEKEKAPFFTPKRAMNLISLIATIWQDHSETLSWLKNCLKKEQQSYIPISVIYVIAKEWKEDPETLSWLKDRAVQDKNEYVRQAAVNVIAKEWKEDPETLSWLKNRAVQDKNEYVRQIAVKVIAQGWKRDHSTLLLLKNDALCDKSSRVRLVAIEAIIQDWKEYPDILPLLKDIIQQDNNDLVRASALAFIIRKDLLENFGDSPQTIEILNQVAVNDVDEKLREFAQEKLDELNL